MGQWQSAPLGLPAPKADLTEGSYDHVTAAFRFIIYILMILIVTDLNW